MNWKYLVLCVVSLSLAGCAPRAAPPKIDGVETQIDHGWGAVRYTGIVVKVEHTQRDGGSPFSRGPQTFIYFADGTVVVVHELRSVAVGPCSITVAGQGLRRIERP